MRRFVSKSALILALLSACATPEESATEASGRTVVVYMRDNHFEPDEIDVERGEAIDFRFINAGKNTHDAFIGDRQAQAEHEQEMRMSDADEHGGHAAEETDAITVEAGKRGTLTHEFSDAGTTLIACHEPGHYKAGMVVTVRVT